MGWGPINPVPVDVGIVRVQRSPIDTGTVPIPESRIDIGTVHAHASIPTGVQTLQKSNVPTMPLWML